LIFQPKQNKTTILAEDVLLYRNISFNRQGDYRYELSKYRDSFRLYRLDLGPTYAFIWTGLLGAVGVVLAAILAFLHRDTEFFSLSVSVSLWLMPARWVINTGL
jgi:hypothetical protein